MHLNAKPLLPLTAALIFTAWLPPAAVHAASPDQLAQLVAKLKDNDPSARMKAVDSLGELGRGAQAAVPALIKMLDSDENSSCRRAAAGALGQIAIPAETIVPALIRALSEDKESWVRGAAAAALGSFSGSPDIVVPALVKALADEGFAGRCTRVRDIAARILGRIAPERFPFLARGEKSVRPLMKVLAGDNLEDRLRAADRLGQLGEIARPATPALLESLKTDDADLRIRAARALWNIQQHPRAVDAAVQEARRPDAELRLNAVILLSQMGASQSAVAKALAVAVNDTNPQVRRVAVLGLGTADVLTKALTDSDADVRRDAAKQLGRLPNTPELSRKALLALFDDDSLVVRTAAAGAMWRIEKHPRTLDRLMAVLRDGDQNAKCAAIRAIEDMGPAGQGAAVALADMMSHRDAAVRYLSSRVLRDLGPHAKAAEPKVRALLKHESEVVRRHAQRVLDAMRPEVEHP